MATDSRGDYDARITEAILNEAAAVIREFGFAGRHVILIGGLVPGVLVPVLDPGIEPHVGSRDIDLCLSAALVAGDVGEYERVETSLRKAGFEMVRKADGTRESWRWAGGRKQRVTIEFFCPATRDAPAGRLYRPGGLVGGKLCALALDAGRLLDEDNVERTVSATAGDGRVDITIRVSGLAAYVATKVDAIAGRSKNKDAYDLVWLLDAWPGGADGAAKTVRESAVWTRTELQSALDRLERQFAGLDDAGPRQYAQFIGGASPDLDARHASDSVGTFSRVLRELGRTG